MLPTTHTINVGGGGSSMYEPDTVYANVGDFAVFKFYPTNHSVVRGEYTQSMACNGGCNPCVPYELIHPDRQGFHSGNILTQNSNGSDLTFNITINDTSPIWFYCTALHSCHLNGMVGVINPANGTSIDEQRQAAISAPYQLLPGEAWPAEGGAIGSEVDVASPSPSTRAVESLNQPLSRGAIAGIFTGAIILVVIGAALFYFIGRSKASKDVMEHTSVEASSNEGPRSLASVVNTIPQSFTTNLPNELWSPVSPVSTGRYLSLSEETSHLPAGHPAFGICSQMMMYELEGDTSIEKRSS